MTSIKIKEQKYATECAINTNAWRIRPVLEGFLLFLLIILLLLALCRHKLLGSSGLGEGGGHELADVASLCLHQLLYRRHIHRIYPDVDSRVKMSCLAALAEPTDVIVELLGQGGVFVEQRQALVHPLLDHMEMCVHLQSTTIPLLG